MTKENPPSPPLPPDQIFSFAIALERTFRGLYGTVLQDVAEPELKNALRQLADDELGHEKLLLSHLSALGINSPPPDERPEPGTRQPAQQMLFNLFQKGRETARWATTATEALRIAFALETRGERFFASWAEKTTDKEGRHLLDFLTSEEVRHASILKERYRSLTGEDPQPFPEDYQRIPWPDI